jgi:hypothetical protein
MMCNDARCRGICERREYSAEPVDGSLIVVCLACLHAAQPFLEKDTSRKDDAPPDSGGKGQIANKAGKKRAPDLKDGRDWSPGDEVTGGQVSDIEEEGDITGHAEDEFEEAVESESDRGQAQDRDVEPGAVRGDEVSEASNSVERRARRNFPMPKWSSRDVKATVEKDAVILKSPRKAREERAECSKRGKADK